MACSRDEATLRNNILQARSTGDPVGAVDEGKEADLVLLDANPLEDISNTKKIWAVVLRGSLFFESDVNAEAARGPGGG